MLGPSLRVWGFELIQTSGVQVSLAQASYSMNRQSGVSTCIMSARETSMCEHAMKMTSIRPRFMRIVLTSISLSLCQSRVRFYVAAGITTLHLTGNSVAAQRVDLDSLRRIPCAAQISPLRTTEDVSRAFRCSGDKAKLIERGWKLNLNDLEPLSMLQHYTIEYATTDVLERMSELAQTAPNTLLRFAALGVIVSCANPSYSFAPADTLAGEYWRMAASSHAAGADPSLRAPALEILQALAVNARSEGIRLRSTRVVEQLRRSSVGK